MMGVDEARRADIPYKTGDLVEIMSGPMEGFSGNIERLDE